MGKKIVPVKPHVRRAPTKGQKPKKSRVEKIADIELKRQSKKRTIPVI